LNHTPVVGVRKIAVLRALVLGDLIFSLPAFEALSVAYPNAEIVVLGRPWLEGFLPGRFPGVNRVSTFDPSPRSFEDLGFLIHPDQVETFFARMKAEEFDIAISLQGGGLNANPFIRRLGARLSIGAREPGAIAPDRWIPYDYYQNETFRNLELAVLAGGMQQGLLPRLPVLPDDNTKARPFIEAIGGQYAVVHAGARDIRRCWPEEKFAELADRIKTELKLEVVLTGSEVDGDRIHRVAAQMKHAPVNLAGKLNMAALVGILAGADCIVSNDTGVLHLGLAVGTRAVGLFWGEYVSKSLPLTRNNFYPVISWERNCPLCGLYLEMEEVVRTGQRPCLHEVSFLNRISVDAVMDAIEKVRQRHLPADAEEKA
jgi:ADP-heptose:LPS heptosyltransferase